jgi:putative nucleotidyltransferase with HDIG domain
MHAGAVGYIAKPFKTEHLLAVVGGALRHRDLLVEATRLRVLTPMLERFAVVLANTVESKDVATQEHASRLVELSAAVCKRLGLAADATDAIRLGACLHDIGKIAVPEELLRRPGSLTDEEVAIVRRHPEVGASILEGIRTWEEVRLIVRHHHERFDGRGYPSGLKGSRIPLGARIVGVVDAYDVMRGGRPYSAPKPPEAILSELVRERGRQFDPDVVDAFVATLPPDALDDQGAIPDATLVYSRGVPTRLRRKPAAGLHPVRA